MLLNINVPKLMAMIFSEIEFLFHQQKRKYEAYGAKKVWLDSLTNLEKRRNKKINYIIKFFIKVISRYKILISRLDLMSIRLKIF